MKYKIKNLKDLTSKELKGKCAGVSYEMNGQGIMIPFSRKIKYFLIVEGDNLICIPDTNYKDLFDIFSTIEKHSNLSKKDKSKRKLK